MRKVHIVQCHFCDLWQNPCVCSLLSLYGFIWRGADIEGYRRCPQKERDWRKTWGTEMGVGDEPSQKFKKKKQGKEKEKDGASFEDFGGMYGEKEHRYKENPCKEHLRSFPWLWLPLWAHSGRMAFLWTCDSSLLDRYELKLAFPEGKRVALYPDLGEPNYILNIKRGIISALLVPPETEEDKQVLFQVRILEIDDSGLFNILFTCQRPASP